MSFQVHAPVTVWNPKVTSWIAWYGTLHYLMLAVDYMAIANAKSVSFLTDCP